ncbi:DNA alkylation repair protein [filamentous cyanobacterium LEGE 11480]|uniref:DNA alkylation repair protein n=1 Tax=Romeriopsis navalis LEGE 11480 TaxID=2777977 RepID=A0A928Z6N5_9CYAN|nr:hypothetical protein [Romeriopsis navalis]MBE9032390.1 DNA alkylation repair protein [Romeriopsis navalis LEGE 11480]
MPEPLKNVYTPELIRALATAVKAEYSQFDVAEFERSIFNPAWQTEELKQRMRHIAISLQQYLPQDYAQAIALLLPVAAQFGGSECGDFEYMFFPDFVALYGLEDFEISMSALEHFTKFSSSEFAVRPFIVRYGDQMMQQMHRWAASDDPHVRRLASEGCRPRLPWAMALPQFKQAPTPVLPILEKLKNDDSLYVRRSVANNLNDIAKDHPQIVVDIAHRWFGQSPEVDWLVKHACRSLLKQGEPAVMSLFGFAAPDHVVCSDLVVQPQVSMGDALTFAFELHTDRLSLGQLRLEYAIDFMKAQGKRSRKVFKIAEADYQTAHKQFTKRHSFKPISTRTYYPGRHGLHLMINGIELAAAQFELVNL